MQLRKVLRRLEAIEKQRLRARERKLDRGRRRIAFAKLLEHSALMLQRVERGRQARTVGRIRAQAVAKISKWLMAMIRRALLVKATKNRAILQMMVAVSVVYLLRSVILQGVKRVCAMNLRQKVICAVFKKILFDRYLDVEEGCHPRKGCIEPLRFLYVFAFVGCRVEGALNSGRIF